MSGPTATGADTDTQDVAALTDRLAALREELRGLPDRQRAAGTADEWLAAIRREDELTAEVARMARTLDQARLEPAWRAAEQAVQARRDALDAAADAALEAREASQRWPGVRP